MQARDIADITYSLIRQREDRLIMQHEDRCGCLLRENNILKSKYDNLKVIAKKQRDNYDKLYKQVLKHKDKKAEKEEAAMKFDDFDLGLKDTDTGISAPKNKVTQRSSTAPVNSKWMTETNLKLMKTSSPKPSLGQKRSISFRDTSLYSFDDPDHDGNKKNEWLDNERGATLVKYFSKATEIKTPPTVPLPAKSPLVSKEIEIIDLEHSLNNDELILQEVITRSANTEELQVSFPTQFNQECTRETDKTYIENNDDRPRSNSHQSAENISPEQEAHLDQDDDEEEQLSQPINFNFKSNLPSAPTKIDPIAQVDPIVSPKTRSLSLMVPSKTHISSHSRSLTSYPTSSKSCSSTAPPSLSIFVIRGKRRERFPLFSCKACEDSFNMMLRQKIIGNQKQGFIGTHSIEKLSKVDTILKKIEQCQGMGSLTSFMKKRPSEKSKDVESLRLNKLYDELEKAMSESVMNDVETEETTERVVELTEKEERLVLDVFARCNKHKNQSAFVSNTPEDFWDLTIRTPDEWHDPL